MLQLILLYQAQFKKEFYIFQHTLLCPLARVKIEHYAQYDDRMILIYSMY